MGCRHGGVHRHDLVARGVDQRVLRPPRRRPHPLRPAQRGRRQPRGPVAVRPVMGGQQLPARRGRTDRSVDQGGHRRRAGVRGPVHPPLLPGCRGTAGSAAGGVPEPPWRIRRPRERLPRSAGGLRASAGRRAGRQRLTRNTALATLGHRRTAGQGHTGGATVRWRHPIGPATVFRGPSAGHGAAGASRAATSPR
jgi:hypothetical protein